MWLLMGWHRAGPGAAHLGSAAAVDIGAHGVVGTGPTHVQVRSVPGLDEPDEVPALTLGKAKEVPRCLPAPLPPRGPLPLTAPCKTAPLHPPCKTAPLRPSTHIAILA